MYLIAGYEVHGLENIPDEGGALLIYYHGALPIDVYYMMGRIKTTKKRNLRNVVAEFMFRIPGKLIFRLFLLVNSFIEGALVMISQNLKTRFGKNASRLCFILLLNFFTFSSSFISDSLS